MKKLTTTHLLAILITTAGCSGEANIKNSSPETKIYGLWNCKLTSEEEDIKVSMDVDISYTRNGKSNGFGTLTLQAPDFPKMEYSIASSSNWEYQNGYLIETTTEINLLNVSHPELDGIFNLGDFFPQNISESSEILVLDDSTLTLKSESYGTIYSCEKVTHKT